MNLHRSNETTSEKSRSCVTCARRKVRCDKQVPCSRCQRAGIQCIPPSVDRRPRWVRNIDARSGKEAANLSAISPVHAVAADQVLARLKHLEGLVKELSGELEHARTMSIATRSPTSQSTNEPGRIILDDSDNVRYVSNGFWSRIDAELNKLKEDTHRYRETLPEDAFTNDSTFSQTSPTGVELGRAPSDRNAFLFKHNLDSSEYNTTNLLPMASQVPFLLEIYAERVHLAIGLPHLPTFKARLRQCQLQRMGQLPPREEALLFSTYYAAIGSMDDDEVNHSFNAAKAELLYRYRSGLEYALAKADFMNDPSELILQALNIFLSLARRHESPRFVWMMTGLAIRMAHYLGVHRDGSNSKHLTPFQIEIQRRIWSDLCALDLRVTEDQGTELGIPNGSYTTQRPTNINDTDIWPDMKHIPQERRDVTDITLLRLCHESAYTMQDMMAARNVESIDDHNRRINNLQAKFDREYFNLVGAAQHPAYAAMAGTMRVILGRLTLLAYPPILYSSPGEKLPLETRNKLFASAIDVAEHNHALNSDASCRPWRWIYQTQQHWHAVIYMLLEICSRPWSSTVERAWIALQSPWLVPLRSRIDGDHSLWAPVKNLMLRARKHRDSEISRLQNDPAAAAQIEREDQQQIRLPSSSTTFPHYFDDEIFRERWRQLVRVGTASTAITFSSNSVPSSDNPAISSAAVSVPSFAATSTTHDTALSRSDFQALLSATPNDVNASSQSAGWMGSHGDVLDHTNLDAFLEIDEDMDYLDDMNIDDALNFDWNAWFESTKGVF